jgi:hypothetical protein
MTKTIKTPDDTPEEIIPSKRTFFLPFEGRTIEAEDLADVDTKLNKAKESEVGDGNS